MTMIRLFDTFSGTSHSSAPTCFWTSRPFGPHSATGRFNEGCQSCCCYSSARIGIAPLWLFVWPWTRWAASICITNANSCSNSWATCGTTWWPPWPRSILRNENRRRCSCCRRCCTRRSIASFFLLRLAIAWVIFRIITTSTLSKLCKKIKLWKNFLYAESFEWPRYR